MAVSSMIKLADFKISDEGLIEMRLWRSDASDAAPAPTLWSALSRRAEPYVAVHCVAERCGTLRPCPSTFRYTRRNFRCACPCTSAMDSPAAVPLARLASPRPGKVEIPPHKHSARKPAHSLERPHLCASGLNDKTGRV